MKTNWPVKKLEGSFTQPSPQIKGVPKQQYKTTGKFPVIDQGALLIPGYTDDEKKVYKGNLPVVVFGDHTRIFKFVDFPFIPGADGTKILIPSEEFFPMFFYFALKNLNLENLGYSRHFKILKSQEITVPPIEEQKRIVAKLEKILSKISEAKNLREESSTSSASLLPSALHNIFSRAKKEKWEIKTVGGLCEKPQYGYTASAKREKIGPKLLRITDIQNGKVDWETVPYCKCDEINKYELQNGDIVFARTGATVGKSFLIESVPEESIFASYLIRLRVKENVLPDYLYIFFQSPNYWDHIAGHQTGMAQPNVNATKLSEIEIPVPGLKEQEKIVTYFDELSEKVQRLQNLQEEQLQELEALKTSVLHQAFQGKL